MIEIAIKTYLKTHLNVPVFFEYTGMTNSSFVIIEKTSSAKHNQLNSSTFAFQSYGTSMYEAAKLNNEVKQIVEQMIKLDSINRISLNSDYNYTDTDMKIYRYQAVFDITHY